MPSRVRGKHPGGEGRAVTGGGGVGGGGGQTGTAFTGRGGGGGAVILWVYGETPNHHALP